MPFTTMNIAKATIRKVMMTTTRPVAAMLAGGLWGIETELSLEAPLQGNAYVAERPRVPTTTRFPDAGAFV